MTSIQDKLSQHSSKISAVIENILNPYPLTNEIFRPEILLEAMKYSSLGGKAIRSFLAVKSTEMLNGDISSAYQIGAAIELLHSYSLIHDDLPAMDNDDFRRGKPSCHKKFDEATAILAGDALLTISFQILSSDELNLSPQIKLKLISQLAQIAGVGGMIGGQILDIYSEGKKLQEDYILRTSAMKTGALIAFSARCGAIISDDNHEQRLSNFGYAIGLAFQLSDDILDATADSATLGKTSGKDLSSNKATIVNLFGIDAAKKQLDGLIKEAKLLLEPFGEQAEYLLDLTDFIRDRSF